jgi:hypothetical protein
VVTYTQLAERNVSFQLLRTNPKLTTNIKLTVDSDGGLWLNSINANEQLADQKYKRFAINENSSHEINLHRFYDNGKTPASIAYQVGSTIGRNAVAKDLKDQFDFDLYTSGAKYLTSRQYAEKFSYFAPLYLDQVVPTKFVIFKMPGPSNYTAGQGKTLHTISVEDFATDAFKQATIVKVFDLGKTSKIGQYLENMVKNPMFTRKPMYINHKLDGYSLYRGASIASGTYVEIPEQLSTVFSRSLPLLKIEEFVTLGYERNRIVYPKILNIEFLFDDETSSPYEFNRYFGFYCNDIDLEEFEIDLDRMYSESSENVIAVEAVDQLTLSPSSTFSLQATGTNLDDLGVSNVSFSGSGNIEVTGVTFSGGVLTITGTYTSFPQGTTLTITADRINPIIFEYRSSTISDPWIELQTLNFNPLTNDQPLPVKYAQSDDISFILTNSTGVKLNGKGINQDLSDINLNRTSTETLFFPYLKGKTGDLHLINPEDWNQDGSLVTFKIDDVRIDLGTLFGPTDLISQPTAAVSDIDTRSTVALQIVNKPDHLDRLRIYHPSGSCFDVNDIGGRYDEVIFVKSYFTGGPSSLPSSTAYIVSYPDIPTITFSATDPNSVPPSNTQYSPATIGTQYISSINNSKWYFNGTEYVEGVYGSRIYVNADLDINQIIEALYGVTIELRDSSILAVPSEIGFSFIQSRKFGDSYGELKIRVISANPNTFKINGESTSSTVFADGGFLDKPHALIDVGNIQKLTPILDNIVVKTNTNWSKISRVSRVFDLFKVEITSAGMEEAMSYFNKYSTIELVDDEVVNVIYDKIEIRKLYKPTIGVLSLFEIMDIDFSTYSTRYSRNLLLDLYKDVYIPPNVNLLDFTKYTYQIIGDGDIEINGVLYDIASVGAGTRPLVWQNTPEISKYTVVRGDAILIYGKKLPNTTLDPTSTAYPDRLDLPYYDGSNDLIDYSGPFALKANHAYQSSQNLTYQNRDRYLLGNVSSEYHVYLENFNSEYATAGRVIPYITKWGLEDSTDSRDNPYRLNSDLMFGKDNFGPSHRESSPTPEKLTHEWFYIESDFGYTIDPKLARHNFSYFDSPLDINQLINSNQYFETYFTYIPKVNGMEVDRPQFRYSILNKNKFTKQYETLFKGAMFRFYEIDDFGNSVIDTNRFEDYKFSVLLKPVKEVPSITRQPIKYRVIENTTAKTITVLIEVAVGHKDQLSPILLQSNWSTPTNDLIDQTTVFRNSIRSPKTQYSIDTTITVSSITTYLNLINGMTLVPADLGKTVHIIYAPVISPSSSPMPLYSTIIASEGSPVYEDVNNGLIVTGDRLGERVYANVSQAISIPLNQGTYPCVKIQSAFQDSWTLDTSSAGVGEITPSAAFTSALNGGTLNISQISASTSPYFVDGAIDHSYKLSQILQAGNEFSIIYGITNISIEEAKYTVASAISYSSGVFTIPVSYSSGGVFTPLSTGASVIFKSNWVISNPDDSESVATNTFSIENNTAYYDSMFGDYRIQFTDVSNMTHSFLYFAKHKKYNNKAAAYSTIKLSRGVDLSASGISLDPLTFQPVSIETKRLQGLVDYDSTADSEISQSNIGFSPFYVIKPGVKNILLQIDSASSITPTNLSNSALVEDGILGANQNLISLTQNASQDFNLVIPSTVNLGDTVSFSYSGAGVPNGTSATWIDQAQHFQLFGGVNYFEKLFGNLSFAKFVQLLEQSQDIISWESYTDGINLSAKKLSIEVLVADEISKSTIVRIDPATVQSGQINQTAGVTLSEVPSQSYSVNRYSGEYDIITRPIAGFKYNFSINSNDLTSANVCLNPRVENFFILPEFEFVKYSKTSILDLENSQNYSAEYPLIGETPIDRTSLNILSSSWDYNYHFEYSTKTNFARIPGSRRVTEDYSFVSKLINVPMNFTIEDFTVVEVSNANFITSIASEANLVYSIFTNEVRFKLNISDLITKHLSNNGLRAQFQKFFKDEFGSLITSSVEFFGDLTFEQYLAQYCDTNLTKLYSIEAFEFYSLNDSIIPNNLVNFTQVEYDVLGDLGYSLIRNVKINNTKSNLVEGSILIKPNTGVKIVPKIKIKFI